MAASDSLPYPLKNVAFRVYLSIFDADGDLVTGATALDSEVSKDAGTFADCTNEATEIATASGVYYLDLTAAEMNADAVCIIVKTSTAGAKTTPIFLYPAALGDWTQIADELMLRQTSAVEAAGAPTRSMYGLVAAMTHKRSFNKATNQITLYKSDDTTVLVTIAVSVDADVLPFSVVDPP